MGTLRVAMQSTRPGQAFIDVTIARAQEDTLSPPGALLNSRSLENLNAPDQERPIEAVSEAKAVDEPQNESSEAEGAPQRASKLNTLPLLSHSEQERNSSTLRLPFSLIANLFLSFRGSFRRTFQRRGGSIWWPGLEQELSTPAPKKRCSTERFLLCGSEQK